MILDLKLNIPRWLWQKTVKFALSKAVHSNCRDDRSQPSLSWMNCEPLLCAFMSLRYYALRSEKVWHCVHVCLNSASIMTTFIQSLKEDISMPQLAHQLQARSLFVLDCLVQGLWSTEFLQKLQSKGWFLSPPQSLKAYASLSVRDSRQIRMPYEHSMKYALRMFLRYLCRVNRNCACKNAWSLARDQTGCKPACTTSATQIERRYCCAMWNSAQTPSHR